MLISSNCDIFCRSKDFCTTDNNLRILMDVGGSEVQERIRSAKK